MPASFRPLHVTRDVPATVDGLGFPARPPLRAGQVVYAHDGATGLGADEVAATLRPGTPWFAVPRTAFEDGPSEPVADDERAEQRCRLEAELAGARNDLKQILARIERLEGEYAALNDNTEN